MSNRSLSVYALNVRNRSNSQRKFSKIYKNPFKQYKTKQNLQPKLTKSFSIKNHPPKAQNQKFINSNQSKQKPIHSLAPRNLKNFQNNNKNNPKVSNKAYSLAQVHKLAIEILKIKKNVGAKKQETKLNQIKRKFFEVFDIWTIQQERKSAKIKHIPLFENIQQKSKIVNHQRKMIPSLCLDSKKFEVPDTFQNLKYENLQVVRRNKKGFPSLRFLRKQRENQQIKTSRRKRTESCKFVVNPFKNIEISGQKKIQDQFDEIRNQINIEQFMNKMGTNEISEIEQLKKVPDFQMNSMSISILELIG